jgi:hypothetical protein
MKKTFHIILFSFLLSNLFSQQAPIGVLTPQLAFGSVYETSSDSLPLILVNYSNQVIDITKVKFYPSYNSYPFSTSDTNFSINPSAAKTIYIKFKPIHNIYHNSEIVIENSSNYGNISVDVKGQGLYSNSYYNGTDNKFDDSLLFALRNITTNGATYLNYNTARDTLFMFLDNKKINGQGATLNTIECVYTARTDSGYADRTQAQTNFNYNTEHAYPQSYFASAEPARSDLHHLFPCDAVANSTRNNNPYGKVIGTPSWSNGGSKFLGGVFEPRDFVKGQVARAVFYIATRYQNYGGFLTNIEPILREWNSSFLPNTIEKKKNNDVFGIQNSRNPFVDYPQFTDRITSLSILGKTTQIKSLDITQSEISFGSVENGKNYEYNFVMVNNGNMPVSLYNFILSDTTKIQFKTGFGKDTVLQAGESLQIKLNLNTTFSGTLIEVLLFKSDIGSQDYFSIPIFADYPVSVFENTKNNTPELKIFPNPSNTYCIVYSSNSTDDVFIYSTTGQIISCPMNILGNGVYKLNTETLAAGQYIIKSGERSRILIKQ